MHVKVVANGFEERRLSAVICAAKLRSVESYRCESELNVWVESFYHAEGTLKASRRAKSGDSEVAGSKNAKEG